MTRGGWRAVPPPSNQNVPPPRSAVFYETDLLERDTDEICRWDATTIDMVWLEVLEAPRVTPTMHQKSPELNLYKKERRLLPE